MASISTLEGGTGNERLAGSENEVVAMWAWELEIFEMVVFG